VTIVFDDMQAPVLVLGTRRWQAPAIQSRVRYTGEHSGSASGARAGMWSLRRGGRPFAGYPE